MECFVLNGIKVVLKARNIQKSEIMLFPPGSTAMFV